MSILEYDSYEERYNQMAPRCALCNTTVSISFHKVPRGNEQLLNVFRAAGPPFQYRHNFCYLCWRGGVRRYNKRNQLSPVELSDGNITSQSLGSNASWRAATPLGSSAAANVAAQSASKSRKRHRSPSNSNLSGSSNSLDERERNVILLEAAESQDIFKFDGLPGFESESVRPTPVRRKPGPASRTRPSFIRSSQTPPVDSGTLSSSENRQPSPIAQEAIITSQRTPVQAPESPPTQVTNVPKTPVRRKHGPASRTLPSFIQPPQARPADPETSSSLEHQQPDPPAQQVIIASQRTPDQVIVIESPPTQVTNVPKTPVRRKPGPASRTLPSFIQPLQTRPADTETLSSIEHAQSDPPAQQPIIASQRTPVQVIEMSQSSSRSHSSLTSAPVSRVAAQPVAISTKPHHVAGDSPLPHTTVKKRKIGPLSRIRKRGTHSDRSSTDSSSLRIRVSSPLSSEDRAIESSTELDFINETFRDELDPDDIVPLSVLQKRQRSRIRDRTVPAPTSRPTGNDQPDANEFHRTHAG